MARISFKSSGAELITEPVKFSDDPLYYGLGFKVGTVNWKIFKDNDYLIMDGRKYKINQHVDVGDSTWFLFTSMKE